jgi:hypothetical protein
MNSIIDDTHKHMLAQHMLNIYNIYTCIHIKIQIKNSENSLRGHLPKFLSSTLRSLNLKGNFLSGHIHAELLEQITDLRILILTGNRFEVCEKPELSHTHACISA